MTAAQRYKVSARMLADMAVNQADLAGRAAAPERAGAAPMAGPDQGLSAAEAAQRLAREGPNALPGGQPVSGVR